MIFAANVDGGTEGNWNFDPAFPSPHLQTRAIDAKHGVSYCVIDWGDGTTTGMSTAGEQWRLAAWGSADDDYERLGHWGGGNGFRDPFRQCRGVARYDEDTFLTLGTFGWYGTNANNAVAPFLFQLEYRSDWFNPSDPNFVGHTDDQFFSNFDSETQYLLQSACGPFQYAPPDGPVVNYAWGPGPPDPHMMPNSTVDWAWTGGALTGKLQVADGAGDYGYHFDWDGDPNDLAYDWYCYTVHENPTNYRTVDDVWGRRTGFLYKGSEERGSDSSVIEVEVFYGETENYVYTTQYEGRIYKLVGVKDLGWRRTGPDAASSRPGQPAPGARLSNGVSVTADGFFPTIVGPAYTADQSGGGPVIGDGFLTDPSDPNTFVWEGLTSIELFNADPNKPLDAVVTRHYMGLAMDCGGRVYAVSQRVLIDDQEPSFKYQGTGADVYNGATGNYGPNQIRKQIDPNNPYTWLFGKPENPDPVQVGDVLVLNAGTLNASFLNVELTIEAIDPNGQYAKLDADCGDSEANFDVSYTVFPAGANPIPDPNTNPFTSQALIDVYLPNGTLDTTIDLNTLARPDGVSLGDYRYDSGNIHGVIIHGDVEIDPGLVYDPNDGEYPLDPLSPTLTRLWVSCAGGDGNTDTDDGLDLAVVDVIIDPNTGSVSGASFYGGVDDGDIPIGQFHRGDYTLGFVPFDLWITYSDLAFDGAGNMVVVGGRANNENRYVGMRRRMVRKAVWHMDQQHDPNRPAAAVVGIDAFTLDMNLYGFGTDFGIAFDNTPLSNPGSCLPTESGKAVLIDTEPSADGSLPKTMNNLILCTFDRPVTLPATDHPLLIRDMTNGCADVSHFFTYSIDTDDPTNCTLEARELADPNDPLLTGLLSNQTWYQINSAPDWTTVEPFQFQVCTLVGDCNSSTRVTTADYSGVKAALGQRGDAREDLNGSARVTTADYSVVKSTLGARAPTKPTTLCP